MVIKILVFMIKAFQFSKFHENEVKNDKLTLREV